uniref:Uncharacterized protein n=1 Tax=Ceratitis capitata TaxID=7213 RepID=W8C571_CERCA
MSSSSERYLKKVMRGVEVKHLTLHEAKRTQRHIYGALLSELYFEACTVCAKYFEYLKCEEDALIEDNFITQRMEGNRVELLKLFETCKAAELATKLKACLSRKTAYELLYQALNITRNLHSTYWWLTRSFFEIVIEVTDTFGLNDVLCSEMRAKIYTHYAIFQLNNNFRKIHKSIAYFQKALTLSRAQSWRTGDISNVFDEQNLHEYIGITLASVLSKSAMAFAQNNPKLGIEHADGAIKCLAEVGQMNKKILVMKAILVKSRLLMELCNYKEAMKHLRAAERYAIGEKDSHFQKVRCEVNICKGICYESLGYTTYAMAKLKLALLVARSLNLNKLLGQSLLQMAKIFMRDSQKYHLAENALKEAQSAFDLEDDLENLRCVKYMVALQQAYRNEKTFVQMIKDAQFKYCDLYKLRKWKYQLKPFWKSRPVMSLIKSYKSFSALSVVTTELPSEVSEGSEQESIVEDSSLSESQGGSSDTLDCLLKE